MLPDRPLKTLLVSILVCLVATTAGAEILDASPSGFTIGDTIEISASPIDVYNAAVADVGKWWNEDHTLSGNGDNLYIDARPQGCFCEVLGKGAAVVHLTVTFVNPGVILRLSGGLGPLGLMGVSGNMTWEFEEHDNGTIVTMNYAVGGYHPDGLDTMAPAVDAVLVEQMSRLKGFAENNLGDR